MTRQRKGKRTRVTVGCVADAYAGPGERIVEFRDDAADKGGLIAFRRTEDGRLLVDVYRTDPGIVVRSPALADLVAAVRAMVACPALNLDELEPADLAALQMAEDAIRAATEGK